MEGPTIHCMRALCFLILSMAVATLSNPCDAGMIHEEPIATADVSKCTASRKAATIKHLDDSHQPLDANVYVGTPLTLPPYEDVMGLPSPSPSTSSQGNPIYCVYPPPPVSFPSPIIYNQPPIPLSPPPLPPIYSPPIFNPSPPTSMPSPNPPEIVPSPPNHEPSPPIIIPSPPENSPENPPSYMPPSPMVFVPTPPLFQPPIVYPPPTAPPPPPAVIGLHNNLWCIAKPSVPDPILQEALDYACNSGADCTSIQPNGSCREPNIVIAHASFAFNSYWQRTKAIGGSCDFGGTAMLVTEDPSFNGCHFLIT